MTVEISHSGYDRGRPGPVILPRPDRPAAKEEGFSELGELVAAGRLEILYIVSPPRCLSTALEIALTEIADGQVHEPFHPGRSQDFNEGCGQIINRYRQLAETHVKDTPIRLVVKDLVKQIGAEEWLKLLGLAKECIFTIREPSLQFWSLVKRRANDAVEFNSDGLSDEEVIARIPQIPESRIAEGSWDRLSILWSSMGPRAVAVSCLSFRHDPVAAVTRLKERFGWQTSVEKILRGWQKGAGANFYCPEIKYHPGQRVFSYQGAWLKEAYNSKDFRPLDWASDRPRPLGIYPPNIREYFLKNILPAYAKMAMDPRNLSRPDFTDLLARPALLEINPLEGYVVCQSYQGLPDGLEQERARLAAGLEKEITKRYPDMAAVLFQLTRQEQERLSVYEPQRS